MECSDAPVEAERRREEKQDRARIDVGVAIIASQCPLPGGKGVNREVFEGF
jgi:hypothetical protein